jgi:hypothetical protein
LYVVIIIKNFRFWNHFVFKAAEELPDVDEVEEMEDGHPNGDSDSDQVKNRPEMIFFYLRMLSRYYVLTQKDPDFKYIYFKYKVWKLKCHWIVSIWKNYLSYLFTNA